MTDKITIGMTCYNAEDTISAAASSALAQDYPDFEIIIIDDVSTDGSWDIIQDMEARFPNKIQAFRNEINLGVAETRNRIIQKAQGAFIAFFDDDDTSSPDRLTQQICRIINYEQNFSQGKPVICHTARRQIYPDGCERIAPTMGCTLGATAPHGHDMAAHILYNKPLGLDHGSMPTCSQMARASVYRDLGGFDKRFRRMEDTEFNIRLARAGGHFIGIAEPLVTQTMTLAVDKNIQAERYYAQALYKKHIDILIEHGRGYFDLDWLEAKHDYWEGHKINFLLKLVQLFLSHPLLSCQRLLCAFPNAGYNRAIRNYHGKRG